MGLYQSYQQTFVTNSPALLAEGQTVDALAVGQIGLLDAKTYKAVTAPTYAKNKALVAVWGTPDVNLGDFGGAPNENEYSKIIKGKLIKRVRSAKAKHGQTPLYSLGWSGDVSDTDTLFALPGETKQIFVKLTGTIIDRLYSKQGFIKVFNTVPECVDNCDDDLCTPVQCKNFTLALAKEIANDKDLRKFIRVKTNIDCGEDAPTETTCYKFIVSICDTGDARALGIVQAQYPTEIVKVKSRADSITTYTVTKFTNSAPAAFSSAPVYVPDCASCVSGYTLTAAAKAFSVRTLTSVTSGNVASAFTGEVTITLINTDPQYKTYKVTFATTVDTAAVLAEAVTAGYVATLIGIENPLCTLTTPVTTSWAADGTLKRQAKTYHITLADNIPCGANRLADLQAYYPLLTVAVVDSAGSCVHTYSTTTNSDCYEVGCGTDLIAWNPPASFEGVSWVEVPDAALDADATCKCGIQFETAFFNRVTNDCSFDAFPYENDVVHIEVSQHNADFNGDPCQDEWVFKQLRPVRYPQGHGQSVRKLEQISKAYDQRFRDWDPVIRDNQQYSLQADPNKFYDQYTIEFDTIWYSSGGWSEKMSQSFSLNFFVPEGTGAQIEAALNSYVTSAGIEEDGTAI